MAEVKITELIISSFLSKCECQCSHCLLEGQNGDRGPKQAEGLRRLAFHLKDEIDGRFPVYINPYRSLEYEELPQVIEWNRQLGHNHVHVNVNGTRMRSGKDLREWVIYLRDVCKIDTAELSWFGTESYMDDFVHRGGYFRYLTELAKEMADKGIPLEHKVFIMNSNVDMLPALYSHLERLGGRVSPAFVDYRGYGKGLLGEYLDENKTDRLPDWVKNSYLLKSGRYAPEKEWIRRIRRDGAPLPSKVTLMLIADRVMMEKCESITYESLMEIFAHMERKLDKYLPGAEQLAEMYGDREGTKYYEYRSLIFKWQEQYIMQYEPGRKDLLFSDSKTGFLWR